MGRLRDDVHHLRQEHGDCGDCAQRRLRICRDAAAGSPVHRVPGNAVMDGRCATCKWWEPCAGDAHICLVMSPYYLPVRADGEYDEAPRPEPKAEVGGGPIYTPVFFTEPDFG